jgi:putative copper resistance protein D
MLYVGLAVLFGAAIAAMFAPGPQWIRNGWLLAGAWVVAAGGVVGMILAERAAIGVPVGTLLSSDTGGAFVRLAVAVGVAGFATLVVALRPGRATLLVLAGAVGAAMLVRAGGSHAGGGTTNVLVHALHLAGVGVWIGGLVWLFFGVKRGLEPSAVRRFSNLAAVGLAVVLVSGVLRAANELGGFLWWLDPFETDYRTALVVKLALIAPLVGLGALNRFRNIPRIERAGSKPLLRTVGGEVFLAAAVFAAAGVMTGLPPRGTEAAGPTPTPTPAQEPVVVTGSDFATTTRVRLAITPGTVGANEFVAEVTDYDTGEPIDARSVTIRFSFPERPELRTRLELEHGADGTWRASSTALSMAGTWDLGILVEGATDSIDVDLRVTPITPGQRIDVTETPGLPTIVTVTDANAYAVQVYTDPGDPDGPNTVHVTAFDPQGAELPLASASIDLFAPHGHSIVPELERLGSGHFSASLLRGELVPGVWTYTISVVGEDGTMITAAFEQTFEA